MKIETIKSFILVVLIGISLILSFTLWSYQPNSDMTIGGEVVDEEINAGGDSDETKQSMVKPTNIIFHSGNNHYGFIDARKQDALFEEIQQWVITDFQPNVNEEMDDNFTSGVELVFSDEIPMEIVNSLFTFGEENVNLPAWSMERVHIHFIEDSKSLHLEFKSNTNHVASGIINDTNAYEKVWSTVVNLDDETIREFIAVNEGPQAFYIPSGEVRLPTYSFTPIEINPDLFVNVLFSNPAVVRETSSQSIGETYFTDSRQMSVYQDRMRMEYVNHVMPTTSDEQNTVTETELLDRSITNINNHSGWTGDYRLREVDIQSNRISYQLYYDGFPVFSNYKLSVIQQRWEYQQNSLQLIEYDRPLYLLGSKLRVWEESLMAGEDLISYIENNLESNIENIQNIQVGYELRHQRDEQGSEYLELEPGWYKKENNSWQRIIFEDVTSPKGVE